MNAWVWFALVLVALVVMLLVSYLRLETLLSEREQNFRLRWLGNSVVFEVQRREVSWWFYAWRIFRKLLGVRQTKPKEETHPRESETDNVSLKALLRKRQRLFALWFYFKRSIQVERLELNANLATPDPLWTGTLYGLVSSVIYPLKAVWPKAKVRLQPDFAHEVPSGTLEATFGIRVFRMVVLGLKAFQLLRTLKQDARKENLYGSPNPSQRNRRGHAPSS